MMKRFIVKKVAFQNNLLAGHPTQYKLAMVTPVVVNREKFIDNVVSHTGLHRAQVVAVMESVEECAGDYMELGNAVQLGENLGTLKPIIKVKASNTLEDCSVDSVSSVGIRFIPTGRLRNKLANIGFTVRGFSDGTDVDDSDVVPNNPSGSDDNNQAVDPGNGGASGGGNEMGD